MAQQGTTDDFMMLLNEMANEGIAAAPKDKILFIFDSPGVYQKALGIIIDNPSYVEEMTGGGIDAPFS